MPGTVRQLDRRTASRGAPRRRGWLTGSLLAHAAAAALLAQAPAETGLEPEVLLLARIKVEVEKHLLRQPNYTCVETIERSQRRAPANRYRLIDTLRLEVALVNGREMFSWPGDSEFRVTDLRDIVPTGAIGTGTFAAHTRAVFLSSAALFDYAGREELEGRLLERYDFRVPLNASGYTLKIEDFEAIVAYHGSFWADAETLDLARLDIHADVIPPQLKLSAAHNELWFARRLIGESEFLLPRLAATTLTHANGDASRNEVRFSDCRQYSGESVLSFGEPPAETAPPPAPPEIVELPGGLTLELALESPIESGRTMVGEPVRAIVVRDARRKKEVAVPKGAVVAGRLLHLQRESPGNPYFVVALQFETIEFDNKRARWNAELTRFVSYVAGGTRPALSPEVLFPNTAISIPVIPAVEQAPGAGVFYVKGGELKIPAGSRMTWRTTEALNEELP